VEEVTDEPLYRDRVCGIDIGKAEMHATIRVPSDKNPARRASETRSFATTKRGVLALADWLRSWQVPAVVMEATSTYWMGPFFRLEAEGLECVLADAKQVKNLPGRPKRDPSDSSWLAACFERGAVRPCFVATEEFRIIRLHTRYRRDLINERTREKNRAEKLLETAAIKLSSVITDLHGVTGRDIMDHLIAGQRDPKVLAQLARTRARAKITELQHALEGAEFFTAHHARLLKTMLDRIDQIDAQISELTAVIEELLAPYEEQLAQAESMPGWGRRSAEDAVAETGVDMTRFATGGHLVSWAGRAPLDKQSGKRKGQARHKKGNTYLGGVLGETAICAGRTQTREGARYRKLARSRGKNKACVAVGNTQLKVYHKLLSNPGMRYQDLGPDYYERQAATRRKISRLIREIEAEGFDVTLCRTPEPGEPGAGPAEDNPAGTHHVA
jgi:transposase